jgi:NADH-quinone oxidoreductase subunit J
MNDVLPVIGLGTLLFAAGMWLMLPRGAAGGRMFGTLLVAISMGLFGSQVPRLGSWVNDGVFFILAAVTVLAAVATVTFRNPVYSAIWFGLSLVGTAGLFLFQGAQFLGVATVVVYAGAILVTFLFVLMLAQPEGHAFYDRLSWAARLSALTGALVVGVLTLTVVSVFQGSAVENRPPVPFSTVALDDGILADEHMANLGAQLFSANLVAVEVAGTLLLVALVGTVAIVAQIHKPAGGRERSHG